MRLLPSGGFQPVCSVATVPPATRLEVHNGEVVEAKLFLISGKVQGVFFRVFTRDVAREHGLAGTVRNLRDGRVEAHAEGAATAMASFARALRRGPPDSRVDSVIVKDTDPTGAIDFRITQ